LQSFFVLEDGNVFANQKSELCPPAQTNYKALICFDGTNIVTEEYWLGDNKVSKSDIQKKLNELGYSIEEDILKDNKTKKIKGILNLQDFAERYNLKFQKKNM
jgi:hypothetical protein